VTTETGGLDFSLARPDPKTLDRLGFRFVFGYLKPLRAGQPHPMELSAADIKAYRAAGLMVGVFWETTANRALSGAAGGKADGAAAVARARAVGYPAGCVIIAAVDFDATAAQIPTCVAYLLAFDDAARAGGYPGGAYGGIRVIEAVHAARPSLYLCQTAGWSGGQLSPHVHVYQRAQPTNWPAVAGCDEDVLIKPLPLHGAAAPAPTEEDFVATLSDDEKTRLMAMVDAYVPGKANRNAAGPGWLMMLNMNAGVTDLVGRKPISDPAALAASVADAIPDDIAQQVVDLLVQRIKD
jgi:hypothetical protein